MHLSFGLLYNCLFLCLLIISFVSPPFLCRLLFSGFLMIVWKTAFMFKNYTLKIVGIKNKIAVFI